MKESSEFGAGGANLIAALGSREVVRKGEGTRLDLVNRWVSEKLNILDGLHVEDVDKLGTVRSLLGDERGGMKDINVAAMGEGVSQVLPIITQAVSGTGADCLVIEQPEIHLHPSLQANLADLFIDVVQRTKRQIIVETHSEHLLLRLRRRVAENKALTHGTEAITPDRVAILYVEKQGTESTVRRLTLNGKGHFDDWPKGFFDEAFQEAMALAMAQTAKGAAR